MIQEQRRLLNLYKDYKGDDFIMAEVVMTRTKAGVIEYKMPKEMGKAYLAKRKGEDIKMKPNDYLCKVVNEEYGLKGLCTKVLLY